MSALPQVLVAGLLAMHAAPSGAGEQCVLHLAASNQSMHQRTARLTVFIDDRTVLAAELPSASQHHYRFLDLPLACGPHVLRVVEDASAAGESRPFQLEREIWAHLLFADDRRTGGFQYIVHFSGRPIGIK